MPCRTIGPVWQGDPLDRAVAPVAVSRAPVRALLDQAREVLAGSSPFDPAATERSFLVGLSDYAAFVLLPP